MAGKGGISDGLADVGSLLGNAFIPETMQRFRGMEQGQRSALGQGAAVNEILGTAGKPGTPNYYDYSNLADGGSPSISKTATPLLSDENRMGALKAAMPQEFNAAVLSSMIAKAFPAPESGMVVPEGGTLVGSRSGKTLAAGAPKAVPQSEFLRNLDAFQSMAPTDPRRAALGQWLQKNSSESDKEPLVQVPDPNDPSKGIYVPRSQAIGRQAFQTQRERMPKMQTYFDENGAQQQLDSNDPEDQKIIRAKGLVTTGPSDVERASLGFVNRMGKAEGVLGDLVNGGYQPGNMRDGMAAGTPLVGNYAMSDQGQAYKQAQEDWVRAKLRKESGAVIGPQEMIDEVKTYFPQPGDNAKTIAQKEASRVEAQRQLATTAGILGKPRLHDLETPAKGKAPIAGASGSWAAPEPPTAPAVGTVQGGYRFKGGNPADPGAWEKQ